MMILTTLLRGSVETAKQIVLRSCAGMHKCSSASQQLVTRHRRPICVFADEINRFVGQFPSVAAQIPIVVALLSSFARNHCAFVDETIWNSKILGVLPMFYQLCSCWVNLLPQFLSLKSSSIDGRGPPVPGICPKVGPRLRLCGSAARDGTGDFSRQQDMWI